MDLNDSRPHNLNKVDQFNPTRQHGVNQLSKNQQSRIVGTNNTALLEIEKMEGIRKAFYEQEDLERQDPRNMQIRFILYNTSEDRATRRQVLSDRFMYNMFIQKTASVLDLKQRVNREFGFELEQIMVYAKYELIKDLVYIAEIHDFSLDEDILQVVTLGNPTIPFRNVIRAPTQGIRISDVRMFNARQGNARQPQGKTYFGENMKDFSIDDSKVLEPFFVDFYSAASTL